MERVIINYINVIGMALDSAKKKTSLLVTARQLKGVVGWYGKKRPEMILLIWLDIYEI